MEHTGNFRNPLDQVDFIKKHYECGGKPENILSKLKILAPCQWGFLPDTVCQHYTQCTAARLFGIHFYCQFYYDPTLP